MSVALNKILGLSIKELHILYTFVPSKNTEIWGNLETALQCRRDNSSTDYRIWKIKMVLCKGILPLSTVEPKILISKNKPSNKIIKQNFYCFFFKKNII